MAEYKKILLIDPPQNDCHKGMGKNYPSGALILIGTMCHNQGHDVKIVDMTVDDVDLLKLKSIIASFKPDIVGITMNTFQTKFARKVVITVKEADENILTIVGGPHPSSMGLKIFDDFPQADISVLGEGEFTFLEIVEGRDFENIKGICYKGKINEPRQFAGNLDYIPLPNLDLVDISKYPGVFTGNKKSMYIMASRGCPSHCIYCNKSVFGHKVRYRTPSKVVEEVKWLHEQYGISAIYFQDDTFNLNRKWIDEILNLIIDNKLNEKISFISPFRANKNLVDKELLQLAKDAGFEQILFGVESGNQEMLNRMKKGLNISDIKRAFKLTNEIGLKPFAFLMIGLPGENENTIRDTLNLRRELKSSSGFSLAIPFPNTEFEEIVKEKGHLLSNNYDEYCSGGSYIRTDELNRKQLELYYAIITFSNNHDWILKLPIHTISKNKFIYEVYHTFHLIKNGVKGFI